ncbi:hypothetical protein IFM89_029627 [Coptis chinensis]|uniref:FBD domain-containing protein n=1 Tax=Coptis chinensis TaxID=261450 RepID=A0A835M1N9_9MAGN|nr:hypothetical protein IFM89_029627 [Coptis chinensis]
MKQVCCYFDKENRISHIPDPIRSHIVSFLPMKEAMRSSILSRQWRYVCSSLSNLDFKQCDFEETKERKTGDFVDFIDEMLSTHDGLDITRFSLNMKADDPFLYSRQLNSWISFAVKHNVRDFELSSYICRRRFEKLPQCLFTSSSLTKLSLYTVELNLPTIVNFPVLKSLLLDDVTFLGENLVNKLLSSSSCPVLEKLVIWYCCCIDINTISISIPTLKYLTLFDTHELNISIINSVLRKLKYMCCNPPNIIYENVISVVSAKFDFSLDISLCSPPVDSFFKSASKILVWLRNVEKLCLLSGFIEMPVQFLSRDREFLASKPSSCCSLKHLHVDMFASEKHAQVITLLSRSYPNLQTLSIIVEDLYEKAAISNMANVEECWKPTQLPSGDILNSLKTVDIEGFKGSDGELCLVRFLLENAKILEKMNICYSDEKLETVRCQMCITEMLPKFTKVSPLVTISISSKLFC